MKKINFNCFKKPIIIATSLFTVAWVGTSFALMSGTCNDCHTMHNSQDGAAMTIGAGPALDQLLVGTCYQCHASNTGNAIYNLGTDDIPQVLHTGGTDLAGGNFRYVSAANSAYGHNIADLTGAEGVLTTVPGMSGSHQNVFMPGGVSALTCDGRTGCHGTRDAANTGIAGAHHSNVDGQLTTATTPGNSYRFLTGVQGLEDADWELTVGAGDHNEYLGNTAHVMVSPGLTCGGATSCHPGGPGAGAVAVNGTISEFCASCHDNFHSLTENINGDFTDYEYGIGYDLTSPFIRHPTDVTMPADPEFTPYNAYSNASPVGRQAVPAAPVGTVATGAAGDIVMCLSCHRAHGSQYQDMLRWSYATMIAGEGVGNTDGCFVCHTTKN